MDAGCETGPAGTQPHAGSTTAKVVDGLDGVVAMMVTPGDPRKRGPMVAVATTDEQAMVAALKEDGILTSARDGNIRLSFHCYNSEEDIESVVSGLEKHSDMLVR